MAVIVPVLYIYIYMYVNIYIYIYTYKYIIAHIEPSKRKARAGYLPFWTIGALLRGIRQTTNKSEA